MYRTPSPKIRFAAFVATTLALMLPQAWAAWANDTNTSSGPATDSGAKVLYQEARDAYEHGLYADALTPLQRLLNRYPGYPDAKTYRELRAWLGHAYLATRKPGLAITPLQTYLESAGREDQTQARGPAYLRLWSRIWLVQSYLALEKYQEALIATGELLKDPDHQASAEFEARSLLLEARSLIALKREKDAKGPVIAAEKPALLSAEPKILGEQRLLGLELKALDCARWPSAKTLAEDETMDQLEHRGVCLEEAIVSFEQLAAADSDDHTRLGQDLLSQGFRDYLKACSNPPAAKPGKKPYSARQKSTYKTELTAKIGPECRKHAENGSQLLRKWKQDGESNAAAHSSSSHFVDALIHDLDTLKEKSS